MMGGQTYKSKTNKKIIGDGGRTRVASAEDAKRLTIRGLRELASSHSGVWGRAPAAFDFLSI